MGSALGAILLPFAGALLMPLLYKPLGRRLGIAALAIAVATLVLSILSPSALQGVVEWVPQLGVNISIQVDGWGKLLAYLITGIGSLVFLYSIMYLGAREDLGKFYMYILLFMGAMQGVVFSGNMMSLYIFWELTSISSFLLIGFWYTRESGAYGALKSMLLTVGGGLAMLGGILVLGEIAGTYEFRELLANKDAILAHPSTGIALILILIGAFTKSAQVPFHIWLPDAMSAPTPVSAYLHSATMVKAGLFLVARLWPLFNTHQYWVIVGMVGMITMVLGAYLALQKTDLKAILAMSTISQLGLIMALFGFGTTEAAAAGVFHLLNHSTFKGLLFMVVGIIDHETGTRDIRRLSGLRKSMPVSHVLAIIGAASMAGVPLFNGFLSKELFLEATLHGPFGVLGALVATGSAVLTTTYCLILTHKVFWGPESHDLEKHPHEPPVMMLVPPAILALLVVGIGVYPALVDVPLVRPAFAAVIQGDIGEFYLAIWHGFNPPLFMSIVALVGGAIAYRFLPEVVKVLSRWAPEKFNANNLYDHLWWKSQWVETFAKRLTNAQMTGLLRDYLVFILGAAVLGVFATMWLKGIHITGLDVSGVELHEFILMGVMVAGALTTVLSKTRLAAIAAISMIGMPSSLWFAFMRAPDLALTQLVVEVVTAVLFLLVFAHLPQLKVYPRTPGFQDINALLAVGVGVMAALFTLLANGNKLFPAEIAEYYLENSYVGGGGTNVVNVTLVDFRGFDTMGEISVLAVAALSVYALIRLRMQQPTGGKGK